METFLLMLYSCNLIFSARLIHTSRAYATMSVSVVCDVCAMWSHGAMDPDIFACLDRWISLLLSDNASPGSSEGTIPGFLVEEGGGYGKIGNFSDINYFTYWESGPETCDSFVYQRCWHFYNRSCWRVFFSNLGRKCIISEEQIVLELPTSHRAMLTTARPSCYLS